MKIFSTNIKLVDELTKYIRLQDIEKARYKKFNTPVINDGNIACDEFFRVEELFDSKKDVVAPFTPYCINDVPVVDRTSVLARDIRTLQGSNTSYIESDLPYYVDIVGEKNKRIYVEEYGSKNPKYPHEADYDASGVRINQKLYKNCSVDDVVNIKYYAGKLVPNDPKGVEWQALKLLHDGFPLEAVINIMKEASTISATGETQCYLTAMRFIADYPKLRRYMITYDNGKNEVFDTMGAKMFPQLLETCEGNEKLAYRILWDCRAEMYDGCFMTNVDLLKLGQELYEADKTWSPEKAKIVQLVSLRNYKSYKNYARKVIQLQKRMSLDEVIANIKPRTADGQKRAAEIL